MDYGQPVNTPNESPFFTAGVGNAPENLNPDVETSLNSGIYSPNHDLGDLGNTAMVSAEDASFEHQPAESISEINGELLSKPEHIPSTPEFASAPAVDPNIAPELGELIDISQPTAESTQGGEDLDVSDITYTETLSEAALRKVEDRLVKKFERDDNPDYFARNARKAALANVKNSNGKNAYWTGEEA